MAREFKVGQFFTRKDKKRGKEDIEVTYKVLKVGPKVVTVLVDPKGGERGEEGPKPAEVNMTKAKLSKILKGKDTTVNEATEYPELGYEGFHPGFFSFEESKLDKSFVNKIKQWIDYAASGDIALGRKVVNEAFDELEDEDDYDFENGVAVNTNLDADNEDWNEACASVFEEEYEDYDLEEDIKKKLNNEDFGPGKIDAGAERIKKLLRQGIITKEKAESMLDKLDDSREHFKRRSFSESRYKRKKKSRLTEEDTVELEKILKGVPSAAKLAREKKIDIKQAKILRLSIAQKIAKSEKGNKDIK